MLKIALQSFEPKHVNELCAFIKNDKAQLQNSEKAPQREISLRSCQF